MLPLPLFEWLVKTRGLLPHRLFASKRFLLHFQVEKQPAQEIGKTNSPSVNRKDQKRLEAEFRKKLTPYKKQLTSAEKLMDKLSVQLEQIEKQLADSALYEHSEKARLTELLKQQGEMRESLEEAEMNWIDAQETIESMQSDFEAMT